MSADPLVDRFGREVRDLRISVTDRCNFRCTYCMPEHGLDWLDPPALLSFEEIASVVSVLLRCGVRSIKLTGGEPLARRGLSRLVRLLRSLDEGLDISLTTNGYLLRRLLPELAAAGLSRVTVSCDSLLRHRFATITRRDALDEVLSGIEAAAAAGMRPIKINSVIVRDVNEDEIPAFADLARSTGYDIRFIEFMPLDADEGWTIQQVVAGEEILKRVGHELEPSPGDGPATTFRFTDGSPGSIGLIPSVTAPFCASCDRLRLTADGKLRSCLFSLEETDVRAILRGNGSDEEIEAAARACVAGKWAGHSIGEAGFTRPLRSMSMIGG